MKVPLFIFFFLTANLSYSTGTSSDKNDIIAFAKDSVTIPKNTVGIVNYTKILIKSGKILKLVDIKNPNEIKTLFETPISEGINFKYFINNRFLVLENRQGVYSQKVIDIITRDELELKDEKYSTAIKSINPKDNTILFTKQVYHPELKGILNRLYLTKFDGTFKFISDSIGWAKWSPDGNWILFTKFSHKEGYFWRRNTKIMNLSGTEIQIFDYSVSTYAPIFNNDGTKALFRLNQGSGEIVIVEFKWSGQQPKIGYKSFGEFFYDPVFWSPDGKYFIHIVEHNDGHTVFGNDIILSDWKLSIKIPIIKHHDVSESPIIWTSEHGLITRKNNQLIRYKIVK